MKKENNRKAADKHLAKAKKAKAKGDNATAAAELQEAANFLGFGDTNGLSGDIAATIKKLQG